jgi:curli biogenesis system outer membrane secretion channel CsgG
VWVLLVGLALTGLMTMQVRAALAAQAVGSSTPLQQTPPATQKKRIAVLSFQDASVKESTQRVFGYDVDVGKCIAVLLVHELMKSDRYSVIDPNTVNKLQAEYKLSKSDLAGRESAIKLGKLLGVDAVAIGDVTQFGDVGPRLNFDEQPRRRATVDVTARLVNVATGEIVAVAGGHARSQRTGASLLAGWYRVGDAPIDFGSSDFRRTLVGEAVNEAVTQMAAQLADDSGRLTSTSSR